MSLEAVDPQHLILPRLQEGTPCSTHPPLTATTWLPTPRRPAPPNGDSASSLIGALCSLPPQSLPRPCRLPHRCRFRRGRDSSGTGPPSRMAPGTSRLPLLARRRRSPGRWQTLRRRPRHRARAATRARRSTRCWHGAPTTPLPVGTLPAIRRLRLATPRVSGPVSVRVSAVTTTRSLICFTR